jgi:hypothetical protein
MIPIKKAFMLQQESAERLQSALTMKNVRSRFQKEREHIAVIQGGNC